MLHLCSQCRRHVRTAPCPFCGSSLLDSGNEPQASRKARAHLLTGAAMATMVMACNKNEPPPGPPTIEVPPPNENPSQEDPAPPAAMYGAPPADLDGPPDGGSSADLRDQVQPPPLPDRRVMPLYGAPPPPPTPTKK